MRWLTGNRIAILLAIFLGIYAVHLINLYIRKHEEKITQPNYHYSQEGTFDRAEYIGGRSLSTIIYFADGSTFVIRGERRPIPYPKNTRIKITEHPQWHYKIEKQR